MRVLSAIPGRIRWHVPLLLDDVWLAEDVAADLRTQPAVQAASANAITGNLLLTFSPALSRDEATALVQTAIARVLEFPADRELPGMVGPTPFAKLLDRTKPHRPLVARMLASSFVHRLFDSSPGLLLGTGVDIVTRRSPLMAWLGFTTMRSQLAALGGLGLLAWAIDAAVDYGRRRSAAELAELVRDELRNELYQHLQRLDLAQIEAQDVSSWIGLLEGDLARVHGFIQDGSDPIVGIVANSAAIAVASLAMSPAFGLVQLLLIPPVVLASRELLPPLRQRLRVAQRDADRLSAILHGNVSSLATITSFASQDKEAAHVAEAGRAQVSSAAAANTLSSAYVPALTMIVGTGFTVSLVSGGMQVAAGTLTPGVYNALAATQLRLMGAVGHFGTSVENYQRTSVSLKRIFDVLELQPTITDAKDAVPFKTVQRDILLDNVTFGYDQDRQVLRGLRLRFPAGKTIGIVGATGAGKSTILRLLLRFYDVQGGAVRFDGVDVRDLKLEGLRSAIAMVSQEVAIFAGTIRDNIAYARLGASDAEVVRAAEIAEADRFIRELPHGYNSRVGFRGYTLSAGQRQRLAIARVVLADRPILLFDEATSALDYQTEAAVQRSVQEVTAGRTTIIVAHRLSTIRRADLIYVLDEGQVKEKGVHDELIKTGGIYAAMWKVQTGEGIERDEDEA